MTNPTPAPKHDRNDAMIDFIFHYAVGLGKPLTRDATEEVQVIFEETIGIYVDEGLRQDPVQHRWDDDAARNFVITHVGDMGRRAREAAGEGIVTPEIVRETAEEVMDEVHAQGCFRGSQAALNRLRAMTKSANYAGMCPRRFPPAPL